MSETSDGGTTEKKDDDATKETNPSEENPEADPIDNPGANSFDEFGESSTDSSDLEAPAATEDLATDATEDSEDNPEADSPDEADESSKDSSVHEAPVETQDTASEKIGDDAEEHGEDNLEVASTDEVDKGSTDSSDLETTPETKDSLTDKAADPDDHSDEDDLSVSLGSSQISVILENLASVSKKVNKLSNPTSRQLNQAKNLVLTLAGITGIVMIAAITFFIVMSTSISQKIEELDRVLMAVAKRGIQLGDGIETIAEMDSKLIEVIDQNNSIPSSLSNIEAQLVSHGRTIIEKEENTRSAVKTQVNSMLNGQDRIKNELGEEFDRLKKLINESVDFDPLMKEHVELKNQVESLNKMVTNVESKVQDLYVIKRAEMENAYRQITIGD